MSLLQTAAELFLRQSGSAAGGLDLQSVMTALLKLLPSSGGELNIAQLVSMFASQGGGLAAMASSWLGDGGNQAISPNQIMELLGQGKIADFAQQLGLGTDKAAEGLAGIIPDLIDSNSKGGALLSNAAGSILGKLF